MDQINRYRKDRLKSVFSLMGIKSFNISKKYNLSLHTLRAWMSGKRQITEKGANKLCKIFKEEGWFCSSDWLLKGYGLPPVRIKNEKEGRSYNFSQEILEEFTVSKELSFFKMLYHNSILLMVGDDSMEPYFSSGDRVGGFLVSEKEKFDQFLGKYCIVEEDRLGRSLRVLQVGSRKGLYNLVSSNLKTKMHNAIVIDCIPSYIAPVAWHRMFIS